MRPALDEARGKVKDIFVPETLVGHGRDCKIPVRMIDQDDTLGEVVDMDDLNRKRKPAL